MLEKLKSFLLNDQLFFAIIVVLVGIASFCLGRASAVDLGPQKPAAPLLSEAAVVMKAAAPTQAAAPETKPAVVPIQQTGSLVGSKSGTKYHLTTCPGAKQIKEENKIYFATVKEAEAAGYKPAANCPQLP